MTALISQRRGGQLSSDLLQVISSCHNSSSDLCSSVCVSHNISHCHVHTQYVYNCTYTDQSQLDTGLAESK